MDYEIFCDRSYYDMWCVRPKGSTLFNDPRNRHFSTEEEATAYKELAEKQVDLPEEFKKIVDEHFFEIL